MCVVLLSTYDAALGVDSHAVASSCLTLVHTLLENRSSVQPKSTSCNYNRY